MRSESNPASSAEAGFLLNAVRHFYLPETPLTSSCDINASSFMQLADAHAVVPLLSQSMQSFDESATLIHRLHSANAELSRSALSLAAELCRIYDLFRSHNLSFISLKGPLLSQRLYGDVAVRTSGDLDLLVHRNDVLRARDLLLAQGYEITSPLHWNCDSACLRSRECELQMTHRERAVSVDLHWRLLPYYFASPFDHDEFWQSLSTTMLSGRPIPDLSHEHLLLFLCAHAGKHAFERIGWICDIARCTAIESINWNRVYALASRAATSRQLIVGLLLASDLLGAKIPNRPLDDPAARTLASAVKERLFSAGVPPTPERMLIPWCMRLFKSQRHRLRYLAGHLKPSVAEYAAVRLPPSLYFFYYPFRPLRLATRIGLGRVRWRNPETYRSGTRPPG